MAKKGESKAQKALSVPVVRHFNRKETAWTTKTIPGPHNRSRSVPLVFALRNLLQVVDNEKEARLATLQAAIVRGQTEFNAASVGHTVGVV